MFRRPRPLHDLDEDIRDHIDRETQDNVDRGMAPDEARRQALLTFGNVVRVSEDARAVWVSRWVDEARQDVTYAFRTLRRHRIATIVGILVMALAIGANTAVFSVVHAVLLNPLPYPTPDRIVTLTYLSTGGNASGDRSRQISVPDFLDWQRASTSFDAMAYYSSGRATVIASSVAEYAVITRATGGFFQVLGAQPAAGRLFGTDEARQDGTGVAVVSNRYAREQFGEPASALGRTLRLADRPVSIVGVMPATFDYPASTDIWLPRDPAAGPAVNRRGNNFRAVARVKDGIGVAQAQAEMTAISVRLAEQYPDTNRNVRVLVTPLQREMVGNVESMLYLLLGAVALVLLVACATMATLLLAKATSRVPEIAVRGALGASRVRIVKQLLVEAFVQALAAGALGVAIAVWGTRTLVALAPPTLPRLDEVGISGTVLLFTLGLCAIVSLLFGLPPALQAARRDVHEPLRQSAGRVTGGGRRLREGLVVVEIALAVMLVATCALLVRSVLALQQTSLGFDPANVLLMQATAAPRGDDWTPSRVFFRDVVADAARTPGVVAAGAMMGPPGRVSSDSGYWIDRLPEQSPLNSARPAAMNVIAPGTFAALRIPIQQGRDFRDSDTTAAPQVVIVNEALARAAFRGQDAIGRKIVAGFDSKEPMTIVGVVGDIRQYGPAREPQPEVYMPFQQHFYNGATLYVVVRTTGDPAALGPTIQRQARDRSAQVSVRLTTLEAVLAEHVATPKFRAWLLTLFAAVALCLAMTGVYGVMAYVAGQRSKEIGLRVALGASARSVLWLMLNRGLYLTVAGLGAGILGALASTRLVSGMLFQVEPGDPTTYAVVTLALGLLSLLATYIPARRAARIDPLVVLRQD